VIMRMRSFGAFLAIFLVSGLGSGQNTVLARAGDLAEGAVVKDEQGVLVLNTTPCNAPAQSQYRQFHQPYHRRDLGQASCSGGPAYTRVSVEQQ
jgi:hypothetical protein